MDLAKQAIGKSVKVSKVSKKRSTDVSFPLPKKVRQIFVWLNTPLNTGHELRARPLSYFAPPGKIPAAPMDGGRGISPQTQKPNSAYAYRPN
jgi:hypothetical protein